MANLLFNKINPAIFRKLQPVANIPPDRATVSAAIARLNTRMGFREFVDQPQVDYIMPAEVAVTGPILEDGATLFADVHGNGQWLLPTFSIKDPLNGGFAFTCKKDGKVSNAAGDIIDNYTGSVSITLETNLPAPDQDVTVAGDKILPLKNLTASLTFKLAGGQVLTYQPVVNMARNLCTLNFNASDLGVLTQLYTILSDPTSFPYCALVIQGTYWGFKKKEAPQNLIKFRNLIHFSQAATLRKELVQPVFRMGPLLHHIPITVAPYDTPEITDIPDPTPVVAPENNNPDPETTPIVEPENINTDPQPEVTQPPVDDSPKYDQVDNVPFSTTIPLGFDCAKYPNNYMVTDVDKQTVFGCNPPFDTNITRKHNYLPFTILTGALSDQHYGINAIFRNQLTNNYLIIPEQYLITLEDPSGADQLVPSAYLNTTIDINDANNIAKSAANFKFNVAPNLSVWQLRKVKELILKNLPQSLGKTVNDIFIEYPQQLDAAQSQQIFSGHNIPLVQVVNLGTTTSKADHTNIFHIEFKQVPISDGTAATLVGSLKTLGAGLVDQLIWEIDSSADKAPQSAVSLSLFDVCGEVLRYSIDLSADGKYLTNNSLYDVAITGYNDGGKDTELSPVALISGNSTVALSSLSFGEAIGNISDINYMLKADKEYVKQVLKELRFNADQVDDDIIVTNNTGLFTRYHIKQIDIAISITKAGDTDPENVLTTVTKVITEDGSLNHVPFVLPVTTYLSDWSAIYYAVISFSNGKKPFTTDPVLIDDINSIGKVINLNAVTLGLN